MEQQERMLSERLTRLCNAVIRVRSYCGGVHAIRRRPDQKCRGNAPGSLGRAPSRGVTLGANEPFRDIFMATISECYCEGETMAGSGATARSREQHQLHISFSFPACGTWKTNLLHEWPEKSPRCLRQRRECRKGGMCCT